MVLIISEKSDVLTKKILPLLKCQYEIVYKEDCLKTLNIDWDGNDFQINLDFDFKSINLEHVKYVWHRRGYINFSRFYGYQQNAKNLPLLAKEINATSKFIYDFLAGRDYLSLPKHEFENNKLYNLVIAQKAGFKPPEWSTTTDYGKVSLFLNKQKKVITKGIYSLFEYEDQKGCHLKLGTTSVTEEDLLSLSKTFIPTFIQKEIIKKYEVRVFYLLEETFSVAIMSQENLATKLDFRDYSVFTRIQPIKLPEDINNKLINLMQKLDYKIGVIDFIVDEADTYYFLEINPCGQVMRLSDVGNFNLDKVIANHLNSIHYA